MRTNLPLSLLDYRFGWRWLLPVAGGDKVISAGLNADEQEWWMQASSFTLIPSEDETADGWLVALDSIDLDSINAHIYATKPSWLCAWGSGAEIAQLRSNLQVFSSIREYALLPETNSRVVVPLSSPHFAVAGLCLHRPGRWAARLGLMVARGLAQFGYYGLLRRRVLLIATRDINALPQGLAQSELLVTEPGSHSDYVLYLGTPDDNRKTVVLPLGDEPSSQILKVAESPKACLALQNESQALISMSQTPLAEYVPKLIDLINNRGQITLVQEYRTRRSVAKFRMDAAVMDFLVNLSQVERKQVALLVWLPTLPDNSSDVEMLDEVRRSAAKLRTHLDELAKNGAKVWLHRCHGDFAPWNCSWSDKGLFVFDWEESVGESLALDDAFYFVLSPFIHVNSKVNVKKALEAVLCFASKVMIKQGFDAENIKLYLAIWLLNRLLQGSIYGELVVCLEKKW
ncbi:MAG: aminoglycoside phosphotransferase family protein [Gammaproteobacteria bacterium]|nr:aminoglycoside phosphotransferase family protein [Gammaproteobacteria bacterium]